MLDFVFILLIFLEVILSTIIVNKLIVFEKQVVALNNKLIASSKMILIINNKIKKTITTLNKFVSVITNKKFIQVQKIIRITINIIEIVVLLRSLNLSKGIKSINYKNIKKLLLAQVIRKMIRKSINYLANA